jgi:hypothetical protein
MATDSRVTLTTRFEDMVKGIRKRFKGAITIGGVAYTPATLAAVFLGAAEAIKAADRLNQQWLDALAARDRKVAQANLVYALVRQYIVATSGTQGKAVFSDFGMEAPKPRGRRSAATKAAAAVKGKATRELRGTMGPKQKRGIKANLTVVTAEVASAPVLRGSPGEGEQQAQKIKKDEG